jgi:hypothetical protein
MRQKAVRDNGSFCTGVLLYAVHVGFCVAKAGWESAAGDDEISTPITVQRRPLASCCNSTYCLLLQSHAAVQLCLQQLEWNA